MPPTVLRLKPLLTAKRRLDRLSTLSRQVLLLSYRAPLLALPLIPLQLLLRFLSFSIYANLHRQGYPLPQSICQKLRVSEKNTSV
jgi:hypothetical protein